jgi:hypothetical protein
MNSTLEEIPKLGDVILIRNLNGGLELARYPLKTRRPYQVSDYRNWWQNFNESEFFSEWIKIDHG